MPSEDYPAPPTAASLIDAMLARDGDAIDAHAAALRVATVCSACGAPHAGMVDAGDPGPSLQGNGCAFSMSKTGSRGMAHYGSIHDGSWMVPASGSPLARPGLDPVCDACLGMELLAGRLFCLGEPAELGGLAQTHDGDPAALLAAHQKEIASLCESVIARRLRAE